MPLWLVNRECEFDAPNHTHLFLFYSRQFFPVRWMDHRSTDRGLVYRYPNDPWYQVRLYVILLSCTVT